jgi:cell wall-associated NlpC family hydrolase
METAVVRVGVAPVLAERRVNSEQVTQAVLAAPVQVIERVQRWARIRMEDGYEGWISTGHLSPEPPPSEEWVTMTDLWVNLRTGPDYRMPARATAFIGTRLPLRQRQTGWLGLGLPAGGIGWIEEHRGRIHDLDDRPLDPSAVVLLTTARRFLGIPYLWGGCSPMGLDCSGFVQLVYRLHGICLPRDAGPQADVGRPVGLHAGGLSAAPGDAVFFCSVERPEQIGHVGLALGDGQFIHAAGSDCVRINGLTEPPYGERLVCARRYLHDRESTADQRRADLLPHAPSGHALI